MGFTRFLGSEGRSHACIGFRALLGATVFVLTLTLFATAQQPFVTSHGDNARTAANINETVLTPSNVNKDNFGRLFSYPLDYQALAQPLYVPNVNIPGLGVHNVVYVATMADSVYAFDAESNSGPNAAPLWKVNFTDPANGITTASGPFLPCTSTEDHGPGFTQEGIVGTPTIDTASNTMYLVAKTLENGNVRHKLHALDLATGQEKFGGPVMITATTTSNAGSVVNFNSLHQKNRPGLLLLNGVVYLAFGSNYCNDNNYSWVLGYDATTLQQTGVFNTNPDHGLTSIWQAGGGLAADNDGYIYPLSSEGKFDVDIGGQGYTHAVLKLAGGSLDLVDYFIPASVAFLNQNDLDLSGCNPLVLPDLDGPFPHVIVATGKQGTIYVLDRDNLGMYSANDARIIQELTGVIGQMRGGPVYWNGRVYFSAKADPIKVFSVSGGMLSTTPIMQTPLKLTGAHAPSISANGNSNGIFWVFNSNQLYAYDADNLKMIYNTHQMARDALPPISHFVTQTVANGRVYIATRTTLEVLGLTQFMSVTSGADQSAPVKTALPQPVQIQVVQAYTNQPFPGLTVSFSDPKGGTFNPPSAVTDANGTVSTIYTTPPKVGVYTLTATATGFGKLTFTETATSGSAVRMVNAGGAKQTGPSGTVLPVQLAVTVQDAGKNGVPGVTVTFDDGGAGGILTPASAVTDATGRARSSYQLPNLPGKYIVMAKSAGLTSVRFGETGVVGPPGTVAVLSGDNQSTSVGSPLPEPLQVKVTDQAGNAIPGTLVTFSAPSGSFTGNPATTDNGGTASVNYTAGTTAGPVTITATAGSASTQFHETVTPGAAAGRFSSPGVVTPAIFTEVAQGTGGRAGRQPQTRSRSQF